MVNDKLFCLLCIAFFDGEVFAKVCIMVYFFGDDDVYFRDNSSGCTAINCCLPIDVSVLTVIINKKNSILVDCFTQQSEDILVNIFALLFMWVFC